MTLEADLAAASDPTTSAVDLVRLSKSRSPRVRRAVAENVAAPKEALARLFKSFPDIVLSNPAAAYFDLESRTLGWIPLEDRNSIAKVENTSSFVLERLAVDEEPSVRHWVARNAMTPVETLRSLSVDAYGHVRYHVSVNARTPVDLLRSLASDAEWNVRTGVARNARTPVDLLRSLASDADMNVRTAVAKNASTPVETLRSLAADAEWLVSNAAKERLPK